MELSINNIEGNNFGTSSNVYDIYRQNKDSDIFESVLDNLILDKFSDDLELNEYIKSLPKKNKRIATLSLLSDDNVLWKEINELLKSDISPYKRLKSVYFSLREYIKIAEVERKKHGEIHTPFKELAEPMVKLVEKYDEDFWKNKDHKVLDSSAGYGTFLILAAYKFMVGLKDEFPDEEERFKWIVENCLYYGELQSKSVFSWLVAIDPYDIYKTNIYWGDFLSEDFDNHMKEVWGVEKFDLIIQNPPYQRRNEGDVKTEPMWNKFIIKSNLLLKDNGYFVLVHPSGWRSPSGNFREVYDIYINYDILYLNLNDFNQGNKIFGVGTNFDFYIIRKSNNNDILTKVVDIDDNEFDINLKSYEFIPNGKFKLFNKLISKEGEYKTKILHSYSSYETRKEYMSREKSDEFIYHCVYTITKKNGINLFYSNTNENGHFGIPKVIWSNGLGTYPIIDNDGKYGLTQFSYAIIDDVDNLQNIKEALDSEEFINLMKYVRFTNHKYDYKIISTFRNDFWKEFI